MDATQYPDITTMTLAEAKEYILDRAQVEDGAAHDVYLDVLARELEEAADQRRQAENLMKGGGTQYYYATGDSPTLPFSKVIYDAAWELVIEGVLRPGKRHYQVLNDREWGMCLTQKGRELIEKEKN